MEMHFLFLLKYKYKVLRTRAASLFCFPNQSFHIKSIDLKIFFFTILLDKNMYNCYFYELKELKNLFALRWSIFYFYDSNSFTFSASNPAFVLHFLRHAAICENILKF